MLLPFNGTELSCYYCRITKGKHNKIKKIKKNKQIYILLLIYTLTFNNKAVMMSIQAIYNNKGCLSSKVNIHYH